MTALRFQARWSGSPRLTVLDRKQNRKQKSRWYFWFEKKFSKGKVWIKNPWLNMLKDNDQRLLWASLRKTPILVVSIFYFYFLKTKKNSRKKKRKGYVKSKSSKFNQCFLKQDQLFGSHHEKEVSYISLFRTGKEKQTTFKGRDKEKKRKK